MHLPGISLLTGAVQVITILQRKIADEPLRILSKARPELFQLLVHLPGFEPRTTVPKTVVISISPQVHGEYINLFPRHLLVYNAKILAMKTTIPLEVVKVAKTLENAGFEAFLVGGCVRDIIRGKKPKDWDVATNATPEEVGELFEHSHYDNEYGTVRVVNDDVKDKTLEVIEVTTYRLEAEYSDGRRPDKVSFSKNIRDDLKRRDFTINAMALRLLGDLDENKALNIEFTRETLKKSDNFELIDEYEGIADLETGLIKTVGDPKERFNEDALRMLRAIRLSAQLGFKIDPETEKGIEVSHEKLKHIAIERIGDEFKKIIMSEQPKYGLEMAHKLQILQYIAPELEKTVGIEQNKNHAYGLWEHLLEALQKAADENWDLEIRLSALFHDISKVETRRWSKEKGDWTFYGHEVVGSRVTKKILERLRFSKKTIEKVSKLVRWHMFFSDTEQISLSAVRRMIRNVGRENIWDLMNVRITDRVGMGRPKEKPYRLRKYHSMIEEALRDPISVGMLKITGSHIMGVTREKPGPKIGYVLHALLEEVIEDPKLNTEEYLLKRAGELVKLPTDELKELGDKGRDIKDEVDAKLVEDIRKKHWVK